MVWAGWAVTGWEVSGAVGLWLGNSTIDALDDEMGSLAAALGPELEFHVPVTPRATVRGGGGGAPGDLCGRVVGMMENRGGGWGRVVVRLEMSA